MTPEPRSSEEICMRKKLCLVTFLGALLVAGAAFAVKPEAQGPMTLAVQPAAAQEGLTAQPSPLQTEPDKLFLSVTCTFVTNDCHNCAANKVQDCDFYSCYDSSTGSTSTVLRNCTPCGNAC
jgi:hypothetical protein